MIHTHLCIARLRRNENREHDEARRNATRNWGQWLSPIFEVFFLYNHKQSFLPLSYINKHDALLFQRIIHPSIKLPPAPLYVQANMFLESLLLKLYAQDWRGHTSLSGFFSEFEGFLKEINQFPLVGLQVDVYGESYVNFRVKWCGLIIHFFNLIFWVLVSD